MDRTQYVIHPSYPRRELAGGGRRTAARRRPDLDPSRSLAQRPEPHQAQAQTRRSAARQSTPTSRARIDLSSTGAMAAGRGRASGDPDRWVRLRARPRVADADRRAVGRRACDPAVRESAPAVRLQQSSHPPAFLEGVAAGVADGLLSDLDHRCRVPRALVPGSGAVRLGLGGARAQSDQSAGGGQRPPLALHHRDLSAGDSSNASSRLVWAVAPAAIRRTLISGQSLAAGARSAAQGTWDRDECAAMPEALQRPLAARDVAPTRDIKRLI